MLNLFLVWTLSGWVLALAWAAVEDAPRQVIEPPVAQVDEGWQKKCPYCAEMIRYDAIKSRFCSSDLPAGEG